HTRPRLVESPPTPRDLGAVLRHLRDRRGRWHHRADEPATQHRGRRRGGRNDHPRPAPHPRRDPWRPLGPARGMVVGAPRCRLDRVLRRHLRADCHHPRDPRAREPEAATVDHPDRAAHAGGALAPNQAPPLRPVTPRLTGAGGAHMSLPAIATILSTLGAGAILLKLVEAILQRLMGRQKREQDAWVQRDREARARRMLEEYSSILRRRLLDAGVAYADLPVWPDYSTTDR